MADISIHRSHRLGLPLARRVVRKWVDDARQKFGLECAVIEADGSDTVEFKRPGVQGQLVVTADHFALDAKLGFLLRGLRTRITTEIEKNLDALLESHSTPLPDRSAATRANDAGR